MPIHPRGIWATGDYVISNALISTNYNYALMVEYDCFININLDNLINNLIKNEIDLSVKRIGRDAKNWTWNILYLKWIEKIFENEILTENKIETIVKNGGIFFSIFWCSKRLAEKLYKKRIEQNKLIIENSVPLNLLPFCEKFVVEECLQNNYKCVGFDEFNFDAKYIHPLRSRQKYSISNLIYSSPNLEKSIFHPSFIKSEFTIRALDITESKDFKELLKK